MSEENRPHEPVAPTRWRRVGDDRLTVADAFAVLERYVGVVEGRRRRGDVGLFVPANAPQPGGPATADRGSRHHACRRYASIPSLNTSKAAATNVNPVLHCRPPSASS